MGIGVVDILDVDVFGGATDAIVSLADVLGTIAKNPLLLKKESDGKVSFTLATATIDKEAERSTFGVGGFNGCFDVGIVVGGEVYVSICGS
jgi:hypothetical protein